MAEEEKHLTDLCQFLSDTTTTNLSPLDLIHRLRSDDSLHLGLKLFLAILKHAVHPIENDDVRDEEESNSDSINDKKLGFQSWTADQVHVVTSLGQVIASASRSLAVEQAGPVIVAVMQHLLEFAVCYLEKSEFNNDDFSVQNYMGQLLEILLIGGADKVIEQLQLYPVNSLVQLLPIVSTNYDDIVLDDQINCCLQGGVSCSREEKPLDRLVMTLASECMQPARQASASSGPTSHQDMNNLVFLSQHWAVSHVQCIRRLILICKTLTELPDMFDEKMAGTNFRRRLSFSLRIIKLLGSLVKDMPYVKYDALMLHAIASFADLLPSLFRPCFEFAK